jgi:hypothetical protein
MKARALHLAALALVVFGATSCGSPSRQGADAGDNLLHPSPPVREGGPCPTTHATLVRGNVGPDVKVRVPCHSNTDTAIPLASVDVEGGGSVSWSVSLTGDPAIVLNPSSFVTCQGISPTLASAFLIMTNTPAPGTTYDAVATVRSDDGSFPTGQVKIHAEAVSPLYTFDRTSVDFGDVAPDQTVFALVTATSEFTDALAFPISVTSPFFNGNAVGQVSNRTNAEVSFAAHEPGDYTAAWLWTAGDDATPGCMTSKTVALHARVVAPDAGASDGSAVAD